MPTKKNMPRYSTHKRIDVPEIAGWIREVESGAVPACEDMRALVAHVRHVFATERLWVDRERLARYMGYQRFFPFELSSDEKFLVALWLCTFRVGFFPRWRDLFLYVGRGYGKTGFGSFMTFCMLSPANGIQYYDVDVCATTEDQARIGYDDLFRILDSDRDLFSQGFHWNKVELSNTETQSRFKYWSGNSNSKDGMKSGCVWFDEVHAYTDSASMEVFTGGLGKKQHPRRLMTTTDGDVRDGPLDEMKERAHAILSGERPDRGLLPFMCHLDSMDEAADESAWPKACPRLLHSPTLMDEYRAEVEEWRDHPDRHPMTPTKRFNLPTERRDIAVTTWEHLVKASRPYDLEQLRGKPCVAGIDYAKTTDMVGAGLLFRVGTEDAPEWAWVHHGWFCTNSSDAPEIKAPFDEWASNGLLTLETGPEVPADHVAEWIRNTADALGADVRCVAIDSYRFALMRRALEGVGFDPSLKGEQQEVWLARPTDIAKVQPVVDSMFARDAIAWGDSPLMRWSVNNAKLEPAPNNCLRFGKIEPHTRKTDVFMALVHAMCIQERIPEDAPMAFMPSCVW